MTVKELINELKKFNDSNTVTIKQEYNSNGGICDISDVYRSKYEENTIVLEPKLW